MYTHRKLSGSGILLRSIGSKSAFDVLGMYFMKLHFFRQCGHFGSTNLPKRVLSERPRIHCTVQIDKQFKSSSKQSGASYNSANGTGKQPHTSITSFTRQSKIHSLRVYNLENYKNGRLAIERLFFFLIPILWITYLFKWVSSGKKHSRNCGSLGRMYSEPFTTIASTEMKSSSSGWSKRAATSPLISSKYTVASSR